MCGKFLKSFKWLMCSCFCVIKPWNIYVEFRRNKSKWNSLELSQLNDLLKFTGMRIKCQWTQIYKRIKMWNNWEISCLLTSNVTKVVCRQAGVKCPSFLWHVISLPISARLNFLWFNKYMSEVNSMPTNKYQLIEYNIAMSVFRALIMSKLFNRTSEMKLVFI